jgi:hypothetical protein
MLFCDAFFINLDRNKCRKLCTSFSQCSKVLSDNLASIRTSTDGTTWAQETSNFGSTAIRAVAHGNNLWVAGGGTGQLRTESVVDRVIKLTATVTSAGATGSEATAILEKTVVVA